MTTVRIVTGKGGVGKSVVAASLALAEANRGRRVLLLGLNGGGEPLANLLNVRPFTFDIREALPRLYAADLNPHQTLQEYAAIVLHFETVARALLENRFVHRFLQVIPSLGELVMLGKVYYHTQQRLGAQPRFHTIVVDAPATGHAIALLGAPRAVCGAVPAGPLRDNAEKIDRMLKDHRQTMAHLVTTPEDMPVNEALVLQKALEQGLGVRVGPMIINQRVAPLPDAGLAALENSADTPEMRAATVALRLREQKRLDGESHLRRLPTAGISALTFPRRVVEAFNLDIIQEFAALCEQHAPIWDLPRSAS